MQHSTLSAMLSQPDQATPDATPAMGGENVPQHIARLVSVFDDEPAARPAPLPCAVTPCTSAGSMADAASITGRRDHLERDYHVDAGVIGTGHHGAVRACVDRVTGARRAVKSVWKNNPAVTPGGLAREILLSREMEHENIVRLVDVYEDADYVHLVTELCEGGELFDRIYEKSASAHDGTPCFQEAEAARTIYQIIKAVAYMHDRGVVHRDLKPENVLFETAAADAPIKLIDFGLSRKHDAGREPPMRTVVGTPYYIAPEVLRQKYDKSCDAWSVGVIAYILLCGYPPFNGADDKKTRRSILRGRYYFIEEDWRGISMEAMDFIHRLLQVEPGQRMSVKQALNHPWIVHHTDSANLMTMPDDVQDNSSVEVLYSAVPKSSQPTLDGGDRMRSPAGSPARKVRMSTFGL